MRAAACSAPGDGKVDWLGVTQALKDIGFAGHLTMEIGFHTRTADADQLARRALSYLKGIEKQLA
jgi:protein FrlC